MQNSGIIMLHSQLGIQGINFCLLVDKDNHLALLTKDSKQLKQSIDSRRFFSDFDDLRDIRARLSPCTDHNLHRLMLHEFPC